MKHGALLAALVLSLLATGCEKKTASTTSPAAPSTVMLTLADNGKTIDLQVGQEVTISLAGNPTTGFEWAAKSVGSGILETLIDGKYTPDEAPEGLAGSGGAYTWTFRAIESGEANIELAYARSWETDTPPSKTFALTLRVAE